MNKVARFSAKRRAELFEAVAERRRMGSAAVVEKDFWVCWTLKRIFEHPQLAALLRFKGGTSLSKVYGLIDRFSEDIDLILDWRVVTDIDPLEPRSKTQQAKINQMIDEGAQIYIAGILAGLLTDALGDICQVESGPGVCEDGHIVNIHYPETANSGYLRPCIRLEIGPLAAWVPHHDYAVRSYAAEEFPDLFECPECRVKAIDATRTFWEKATILHHEANRPATLPIPSRYSRHYYDLYMMARHSVKTDALNSLDLLSEVVAFKKRFYPRGWARYDDAYPGTFKLLPPERALAVLSKDYESMQEMIFGNIPDFGDIISGLEQLESEINAMTGRRK